MFFLQYQITCITCKKFWFTIKTCKFWRRNVLRIRLCMVFQVSDIFAASFNTSRGKKKREKCSTFTGVSFNLFFLSIVGCWYEDSINPSRITLVGPLSCFRYGAHFLPRGGNHRVARAGDVRSQGAARVFLPGGISPDGHRFSPRNPFQRERPDFAGRVRCRVVRRGRTWARGICTRREGKLYKARSRNERSRRGEVKTGSILQTLKIPEESLSDQDKKTRSL